MFSTIMEPSIRRRSISYRKVIIGMVLAVVGIRLLWLLPTTHQAAIMLLGAPKEIPLPTLDAPNAIKPDTVANVRLLEHWGNGTFKSIAWSPDGRYFVIGTTLGINLYHGQTNQLLRYISLPLRNVDRLTFSPGGALLAVAAERNILIFDLANDRVIQQWDMDESVVALVYLKDSTLVCVTDMQTGGNARSILKLTNNNWQTVKTLDDDFLLDVAFVPEKQTFVVFYTDSVRLVEPVSGKEKILPHTVPYGGDFVLTQDILLTVDRDRNLMSDYAGEELLTSIVLEGAIDQPLASPDGSLLAALGPNPNNVMGDAVTLWKIPGLEQIRTIWVPDISPYVHNDIAFSPAGDRLALLMSDSVVKIFPTAENNTSETVIHDSFASIADIAVTPGGEIRAVSCSGTALDVLKLPSAISIDEWYFDEPTCGQLLDDGASVAIAEPYEPIHLYRVGEIASPVIVKGSTFSDDGSVGAASGGISSSGDPVTVMIWQRDFGFAQRWNFYNEGHEAFNIAVSASGQYVAASSRSNTHLWVHGIKTGRLYPALISRVAFSPDEKYLASANGILELETGQIIATEIEGDLEYYPYHSMPAFSPDGQILAAEMDGTLRFWQANNGALLAKLDDPHFSTYELIFSTDGTFLVGLGEGFVNVWGLPRMNQ